MRMYCISKVSTLVSFRMMVPCFPTSNVLFPRLSEVSTVCPGRLYTVCVLYRESVERTVVAVYGSNQHLNRFIWPVRCFLYHLRDIKRNAARTSKRIPVLAVIRIRLRVVPGRFATRKRRVGLGWGWGGVVWGVGLGWVVPGSRDPRQQLSVCRTVTARGREFTPPLPGISQKLIRPRLCRPEG